MKPDRIPGERSPGHSIPGEGPADSPDPEPLPDSLESLESRFGDVEPEDETTLMPNKRFVFGESDGAGPEEQEPRRKFTFRRFHRRSR